MHALSVMQYCAYLPSIPEFPGKSRNSDHPPGIPEFDENIPDNSTLKRHARVYAYAYVRITLTSAVITCTVLIWLPGP